MLNVLRNNYCRMLKRLPMTLALIFVTLISLLLGVYISGQQVKGHIAVVYQKSDAERLESDLSSQQSRMNVEIKTALASYDQEKAVAEAEAITQVQHMVTENQLAAAESRAKAEVDCAFDQKFPSIQIRAMRKMIQFPVLSTLSTASQKLDVIKGIKNLCAEFPNATGRSSSLINATELENYAIIQYANILQNQRTDYFELHTLSTEPSLSSLLRQKYDALLVIPSGDTGYSIKTLRNSSFKEAVRKLIDNQNANSVKLGNSRNRGETITGFLLLFLLLSIFSTLFTLSDDKERGMLVRLNTTPMKVPSYLLAQMLYALTALIPSFIALAILNAVGVNIGLTLTQYALVYLCVALFGIPLALWFITIFRNADDATLFGNSILILSTILSGAFFSVNNKNQVFKDFTLCLPQKQILNFVENLHNGTAASQPYPIIYILAAGILLFGMATVNLRYQAHKVR